MRCMVRHCLRVFTLIVLIASGCGGSNSGKLGTDARTADAATSRGEAGGPADQRISDAAPAPPSDGAPSQDLPGNTENLDGREVQSSPAPDAAADAVRDAAQDQKAMDLAGAEAGPIRGNTDVSSDQPGAEDGPFRGNTDVSSDQAERDAKEPDAPVTDTGPATSLDSGMADAAGGGPVARRLPLPCTAPLPTGYCFSSEFYSGNNRKVGGDDSVKIMAAGTDMLKLELKDGSSSFGEDAEFAVPDGQVFVPGLYDPAERYPFQQGAVAGLSVSSGCNTITGKFSVEEFARDPVKGITRFSITFEQYCDGSQYATRGVINYKATGEPSPSPTADRVIGLRGRVSRVAYDAEGNLAYGLDAINRRLVKIDLGSGDTTYADVVQVPDVGCVDRKRGRLFVVNTGSSLITEYATSDLKAIRNIAWNGKDATETAAHFKITCAADKLFVVDASSGPGLFTVQDLDAAKPTVTDHTALVSEVGGLVLNSTAQDLYYWYQLGWSASSAASSVRRLNLADLSQIDESSTTVSAITRDPVDTPIFLDEGRGLIFVKNQILDASNLAKIVYSLPPTPRTYEAAIENIYALDPEHGLMATKGYVYELDHYAVVAQTITHSPDQMFFDKDGRLWMLVISGGSLQAQVVRR